MDQRDAGAARHLRDQAAAGDRHAGLPAIIDFGNSANLFYLFAGFALLSYLLLDQLVRSPIGETLTAIREDEVSAASLGINCTLWKVFAFGVGSAIAGAAGAFYASFVGTLVPDAFIITESFTILAMVIVGGMGTLIGPVWGAILLTVLPELLARFRRLSPRSSMALALTLVVLFMPGGMVQAARLLRARFRRTLIDADSQERPVTVSAALQASRRPLGISTSPSFAPRDCTRVSAACRRCATFR